MVELELRKIRHGSPDEHIQKILSLSNEIFQAAPDSKYASINRWKQHLSNPSSIIIYLTPTNESVPVAFIFAYPRVNPEPLQQGASESLHIWLAGVRPEYRKQKCLDRMVDELRSDIGCLGSLQLLTLRTVPARFERMWVWSQNRGWAKEQETVDEGGERKVLLSLFVPAGDVPC
jgi:hypothetical protein